MTCGPAGHIPVGVLVQGGESCALARIQHRYATSLHWLSWEVMCYGQETVTSDCDWHRWPVTQSSLMWSLLIPFIMRHNNLWDIEKNNGGVEMEFGYDGIVFSFTIVYRVMGGWNTLCVAVFVFLSKALSRVMVWTQSLIPRACQIILNIHSSLTLRSKEKQTMHLSHSCCVPCSTECAAGWWRECDGACWHPQGKLTHQWRTH